MLDEGLTELTQLISGRLDFFVVQVHHSLLICDVRIVLSPEFIFLLLDNLLILLKVVHKPLEVGVLLFELILIAIMLFFELSETDLIVLQRGDFWKKYLIDQILG